MDNQNVTTWRNTADCTGYTDVGTALIQRLANIEHIASLLADELLCERFDKHACLCCER